MTNRALSFLNLFATVLGSSHMATTDILQVLGADHTLAVAVRDINSLLEAEKSKNAGLTIELDASRSSVVSLKRDLESFKGLFLSTVEDLQSTIRDLTLKVDQQLTNQQTTFVIKEVDPEALADVASQIVDLTQRSQAFQSQLTGVTSRLSDSVEAMGAIDGRTVQIGNDLSSISHQVAILKREKKHVRRRGVETTAEITSLSTRMTAVEPRPDADVIPRARRSRALSILGSDAIQTEQFRLNPAWVLKNKDLPEKFLPIVAQGFDELLNGIDIAQVNSLVNEAARRICEKVEHSALYANLISALLDRYTVSHDWLYHRYNSFWKEPYELSPFDAFGFTWDYMYNVIAALPTDITVTVVVNANDSRQLPLSSEFRAWELNVLVGKLVNGRLTYSKLRGYGTMYPMNKLTTVGVIQGSTIDGLTVYRV